MVEKAIDLADLVRAVGWEGACALSSATFEGWEVDFLADALGILSNEARGQELLEQGRVFGLLGGRGRG